MQPFFFQAWDIEMTNNVFFIVTGILAVLAIILFMRSGSSNSLTEQKRAEVRRKRAALRSKENQARKPEDNS